MKRKTLFFIFVLLFFPLLGFGFSETELDSLESTGEKSFSSRPWRIALSFALQSKTDVSWYHVVDIELEDLDSEFFIYDFLMDMVYALDLNFNYSLKQIAKNFKYDFLKNTELFLNSSFETPFRGYNSNEKDYSAWKYIHYALGDITGGLTAPAYQKGNFLSEFSFSFMPYRLSKYSQETGLFTVVAGAVSFLYFLKKEQKWSLALSSNHNMAYKYYTKDSRLDRGREINVPWSTSQSGSFIVRQSYKYLPSNIQVSAIHFFGIDKVKSRLHDLTLAVASSWKIKDRAYLQFSISWKDRIHIYNPNEKKIEKLNQIQWNNPQHYFVSLGGSYSF